jgi:hypothetical protein
VALQVPVTGSYSSALARTPPEPNPPVDKQLAIGKQSRSVFTPCGSEAASCSPDPAGRIVQFGARQTSADANPSSNKYLTSGKQTRSVFTSRISEEADRRRPDPADWIVQFGGRKITADAKSSCHKHVAIREHRRGVFTPWGDEAPRNIPGPGGRIVQFRARETGDAVKTSCHNHLAVRQQGRCVIIAHDGKAAGHTPTFALSRPCFASLWLVDPEQMGSGQRSQAAAGKKAPRRRCPLTFELICFFIFC